MLHFFFATSRAITELMISSTVFSSEKLNFTMSAIRILSAKESASFHSVSKYPGDRRKARHTVHNFFFLSDYTESRLGVTAFFIAMVLNTRYLSVINELQRDF